MSPSHFQSWLATPDRPLLVMGVLNVTPDSFSDGGQFTTIESALDQARRMVREGADLIDVGGESTRPGSQRISEDEQIHRTQPVIAAIRREMDLAISIDTTRAAVAEAAIDAGACLVNDISAGRDDPALLPLVARRQVPIVLMHMQGTPADMQVNPVYADVVKEVADFLDERSRFAQSLGIASGNILLDPGIGFGKTVRHNLQLLKGISGISRNGQPLVIGASRKSFIAKVTGSDSLEDRIAGTAGTTAWAATNHAGIVRVHDVGPTVQVIRIIRAIQNV